MSFFADAQTSSHSCFTFTLGTVLSSAFLRFHAWVTEREDFGFPEVGWCVSFTLHKWHGSNGYIMPLRWRSCRFLPLSTAVANHWAPWGLLHSCMCCSTGIFGFVPRENPAPHPTPTPSPSISSILCACTVLLVFSLLATSCLPLQFSYSNVPYSCRMRQ